MGRPLPALKASGRDMTTTLSQQPLPSDKQPKSPLSLPTLHSALLTAVKQPLLWSWQPEGSSPPSELHRSHFYTYLCLTYVSFLKILWINLAEKLLQIELLTLNCCNLDYWKIWLDKSPRWKFNLFQCKCALESRSLAAAQRGNNSGSASTKAAQDAFLLCWNWKTNQTDKIQWQTNNQAARQEAPKASIWKNLKFVLQVTVYS